MTGEKSFMEREAPPKARFKKNNAVKFHGRYIVMVAASSFLLCAALSYIADILLNNADILLCACFVLLAVGIGVAADIIGVAVTAAEDVPFVAMASKKIYGAKEAIKMLKAAHKVSNICCDVIGDICGIISGVAATYLIIAVNRSAGLSDAVIIGLLVSGTVSGLTVGGKAVGKVLAMRYANHIVFWAARVLPII